MNKFILAGAVFLLLSCSNNSGGKEEEVRANKTTELENHKLELNNGNKWKLDEGTRKNIAPIKLLLKDTTISDFQKLAVKLQKQTDTLVSECKMKGDDHEALHRWLEKWLEDLKNLKSGRDEQKAYQSLQTDARKFDFYFE
jgi:hypothetical protein